MPINYSKEIDRRLTRSGWFYIVIIVSLLILSLYVMPRFRSNRHQNEALSDRVQQLEQQVEQLESELNALKTQE
ncbi:MAG: hypothetical protein Q4B80_05195 [Aerococcaceae bacterium]|nr:hypothetical protein [Aerococcaceae bacterium]